MKTLLSLTLMILVFMSIGCNRSSNEKIHRALAATNVTFYPNVGDEILLSGVQSKKVKDIVRTFKDRSHVRIEKDLLGFEHGGFRLGNETFSWQGGMLYFRDRHRRVWIVEDPTLHKMTEKYMAALGKPPLRTPSIETWRNILSDLDSSQ